MWEFMSHIEQSHVNFSRIGNQGLDEHACAGFLPLEGFKYMTAMECGQLTIDNKYCGYSFFHSKTLYPQGYCYCEISSFKELCRRNYNHLVTEYRIHGSKRKSRVICNLIIDFMIS